MDYSNLSKEINNILKGYNFNISLFDKYGSKTIKPDEVYFYFINDINICISYIEEQNKILIQLSKSFDFSKYKKLIDNLKKIINHYNMLYEVKSFAKIITPRDATQYANNNIIKSLTKKDEIGETMLKNEEKLLNEWYKQFDYNTLVNKEKKLKMLQTKLEETKIKKQLENEKRIINENIIFFVTNDNPYEIREKISNLNLKHLHEALLNIKENYENFNEIFDNLYNSNSNMIVKDFLDVWSDKYVNNNTDENLDNQIQKYIRIYNSENGNIIQDYEEITYNDGRIEKNDYLNNEPYCDKPVTQTTQEIIPSVTTPVINDEPLIDDLPTVNNTHVSNLPIDGDLERMRKLAGL